MQPPYLTLDTAYWDPKVLDAAAWINQQQAAAGRPELVKVIHFYAFDPFVADVNGFCGGWTPQVVQQIEDAGYVAGPIVTMRPAVAGGVLSPQEIAAALAKYPLSGHPVHIKVYEDQEDGSFTGAAWSQALGAAMPTELYGSTSTVLSDYATGVAAIWVGSYPGVPVLPPPDVAHIPGVPDSVAPDARAWQYVGSASIAGASVDVSISNVPLEDTVSKQDVIDALNEMWGTTPGVGGATSPQAYQLGPQALMEAVRGEFITSSALKAELDATKATLDGVNAAIAATGGHPADAPILAAVANAQAQLDAIAAKVNKDLA